MGAWGTGLWADDVAQDLKLDLKDAYAFNDDETALAEIFRVYKDCIVDETDDDYAVFYYALADWLWDKGRLPEDIRTKVITMLERKEGMERFYETEDEKLIEYRLDIMSKLKSKLEGVQPPRKKIYSSKGKTRYNIGDIVAFKVVNNKVVTYYYTRDINVEYNYEYIYSNGRILKNPHAMDFCDKVIVFICVRVDEEDADNHRIKNVPNQKNAIFAQYDYCKTVCPSIEDLKKYSYVPFFYWTEDNMTKVPDGKRMGEKGDNYVVNLDALKRQKGETFFTFLCDAELAISPCQYKKGDKYQIFEQIKIGNSMGEVERFSKRKKEAGETDEIRLITYGLLNYAAGVLFRIASNND